MITPGGAANVSFAAFVLAVDVVELPEVPAPAGQHGRQLRNRDAIGEDFEVFFGRHPDVLRIGVDQLGLREPGRRIVGAQLLGAQREVKRLRLNEWDAEQIDRCRLPVDGRVIAG